MKVSGKPRTTSGRRSARSARAATQPFGEGSRKSELARFGDLGELAERVELDMAEAPGRSTRSCCSRRESARPGESAWSWSMSSRNRRSGSRVAVGRAAQAEQPPAQRVPSYRARNRHRRRNSGDQTRSGELGQVVRQRAGRSRKPVSPAACHSCNRSARPMAVPVKIWASLWYSGARPARPGAADGRRRRPWSRRGRPQVTEDVHWSACAHVRRWPARPGSASTISAAWPASRGVTNRCRPSGRSTGTARWRGQSGDDRLALRAAAG